MNRLIYGLAIFTLATAPVMAQTRHYDYRDPSTTSSTRTPRPGTPYAAPGLVPQGQTQVCVPWCPQDTNPCDAPLLKQTDGRCTNED